MHPTMHGPHGKTKMFDPIQSTGEADCGMYNIWRAYLPSLMKKGGFGKFSIHILICHAFVLHGK